MKSSAYEWYRSAYPAGPEFEPRLFEVLTASTAIYNLPVAGRRTRPDGGFRQHGRGVMVRLGPRHEVATYDFNELTKMVLAAHRYRCRLALSARMDYLEVRVYPRVDAPNGSGWEHHPGLQDLAAMATRLHERDTLV